MKKKMRYIRTKETDCCIIDTIKYKEITGEDCFIPKNEIVDKAETIEELCDEFVIAYENGARIVYGDLEWAKVKAIASSKIGIKLIIYGAIWTNKGLIYVAKMNDKGELELL